MPSVNNKILRASIYIGLFTLVVKIVAIFKENIVATHFGTSANMDAFYIAYLLPSFVISILIGTIGSAFISDYIETLTNKGKQSAQRYFQSISFLIILVLALVSLIMIILAPYYLRMMIPPSSNSNYNVTLKLIYILSPIVIIQGLAMLWAAVLNAHERFKIVALTPVATPFVVMLLVLFKSNHWGIQALAIGAVIGSLIELIIIGYSLYSREVNLVPRWFGFEDGVSKMIKQYSYLIIASILFSMTSVINQAHSAQLGTGSISVLNYANRLVAMPISLAAMSLGTAALPYFSQLVAQEKWREIRTNMIKFNIMVFAITIPITLILLFFASPIIRLIYEHGQFGPSDTAQVVRVLYYYAWQIPFYTSGMLAVRIISSIQKNYILILDNIVSLILTIVLNIVLVRWLGLAGIALTVSLTLFASFVILNIMLYKHLYKLSKCNE